MPVCVHTERTCTHKHLEVFTTIWTTDVDVSQQFKPCRQVSTGHVSMELGACRARSVTIPQKEADSMQDMCISQTGSVTLCQSPVLVWKGPRLDPAEAKTLQSNAVRRPGVGESCCPRLPHGTLVTSPFHGDLALLFCKRKDVFYINKALMQWRKLFVR